MTDREKIIEIIKKKGTYNGKSLSFDYYVVQPDDLADALIKNIIKDKDNDLEDLRRSLNLMQKLYKDKVNELAIKMKEIYDLTSENIELKYRVDVVERALVFVARDFRCDDCPYLGCSPEIKRGSQECISRLCAECKKQAEKELAEGRKDD